MWRSGSAVKEQITDYFLGNTIQALMVITAMMERFTTWRVVQHVQAGSSAPVIRVGAMFTRMETRGCSDSPTMLKI